MNTLKRGDLCIPLKKYGDIVLCHKIECDSEKCNGDRKCEELLLEVIAIDGTLINVIAVDTGCTYSLYVGDVEKIC